MSHVPVSAADVVVVGAGLAGLVAARRMAAAGLNVLVLEAQGRVGGRTLRTVTATGDIVDGGGQWVGPEQTAVLSLAAELGVDTFPSPRGGAHTLVFRGKQTTYRYLPSGFGAAGILDIIRIKFQLDRLAATVPLAAPWTAPDAETLDAQTFETWIRRHCRTRAARLFLDRLTSLNMGTEPKNISLLYVLFKIHSAGGLRQLLEMDRGGLDQRFVDGSATLSFKMAAELGERVRLSTPATRIEHTAAGVVVDTPSLRVRAARVLVAMDPVMAGRLEYAPALPQARRLLSERWTLARGSKIHCVYERPFWRELGLAGHALLDEGPIMAVFDNSRPQSPHGVLLAFTDLFAPEHAGLDAAQRRERLLSGLVRLFGEEAGRPIAYSEQNWDAEPWVGGCVSYPAPGILTSYGRTLREPVGTVHWASAETAQRWEGHMDGAVRAGEAEADAIIRSLKGSPNA